MKSCGQTIIWRVFVALFILANLLLSSYFLDIWTTANPASRALPILSYSENRTLQIDRYAKYTLDKSFVGGHYYTDKAPLPMLLVIPFHELFKKLGLAETDSGTGMKFPIYIFRLCGIEDGRSSMFPKIIPIQLLGSILIGSIPFTLVIVLTFLALHRRDPSVSPVLMVMCSYYGSFMFVFSGTFFSHVFAGLLLLLSYICLKRSRYPASGFFLGLCFLSEYPFLLAAPLWLILLVRAKKIKSALLFIMGMIPSLVFICWYNWHFSGNPFKMLNAYHSNSEYKALGLHYGFSLPSLKSLWGLSFSGSMGIFPFTPVLFVIIFMMMRRIASDKDFLKRLFTDYGAVFCTFYFLAIASFFTWWGGWSYGPRYLVGMAVLLVYEGLIFISGERIHAGLFMVISSFGLVSAWMAKSTLVYMIPDFFLKDSKYSNTFFSIIVPELSAARFNANNLPAMFFDVSPAVGVFLWPVMFIIFTAIFCFWYEDCRSDGGNQKGQPLNIH